MCAGTRRFAAAALVGVIAMCGPPRLAAQGGPPMLTDDPGTPGDGHWEINLAALSEHAADTTTFELPLLDVNYGLGERLQLKFEIPWLVERGGGATRSGAGNSLAGVKWRFFDAGEDGWQFSTYPQVQSRFPAGDSALADAGVSYFLPVEFAHPLGGDWSIDLEAGRWLRPAQQVDTWVGGVVLGRKFGKALELMAELHDERDVHSPRHELALNFGATWDISQRCTLLASAGADLHNGLGPRVSPLTYLGIQLHL